MILIEKNILVILSCGLILIDLWIQGENETLVIASPLLCLGRVVSDEKTSKDLSRLCLNHQKVIFG